MKNILTFEEVSSTLDVAKDLIKHSPPSGTCITAQRQTSGRGQYSRKWTDTEGSLKMSVILCFSGFVPDEMTVRVGEAVLEVIVELCGDIKAYIKLPNDIMYGDKKLCGILCEAVTQGEDIWVICGIGLNINTCEFPHEVADIATSLRQITGDEYEIDNFIEKIRDSLLEIKV